MRDDDIELAPLLGDRDSEDEHKDNFPPRPSDWLTIIKEHNTRAFIARLRAEGLPETVSDPTGKQWSLLHHVVAAGYYEGVLCLLDQFPVDQLKNQRADGYNPLDFALLMGQRRIAACLRLFSFQWSRHFLQEHQFFLTTGELADLAVALSFWAIVNHWHGLFQKLLSTQRRFNLDGFAQLAYELGDRQPMLRPLGAVDLLTEQKPMSLVELAEKGVTPAEYLNKLIKKEDWDTCLQFLFTQWEYEERRLWFDGVGVRLLPQDNRVTLCLQTEIAERENHPTQMLPTLILLVENRHWYAFYVLQKHVYQDKMAMLDAACGNNSLLTTLCAFSPEMTQSVLTQTLIEKPAKYKTVFAVEMPTAIMRDVLQESMDQFTAVVASLTQSKRSIPAGRLREIKAKYLPYFLLQFDDNQWCMLTQAVLSYFLLTQNLLPDERELCFLLLLLSDTPALLVRMENVKAEMASRRGELVIEIVSEEDEKEPDSSVSDEIFLFERVKFFFENLGVRIRKIKDDRIAHRIDVAHRSDAEGGNPLSRLPHTLFCRLTDFLDFQDVARLASADVDLCWKLTSTLFSQPVERGHWTQTQQRHFDTAREHLQMLNQIVENNARRSLRRWNRGGVALLCSAIASVVIALLTPRFLSEEIWRKHEHAIVLTVTVLGFCAAFCGIGSMATAGISYPELVHRQLSLPSSSLAQSHPDLYCGVQSLLRRTNPGVDIGQLTLLRLRTILEERIQNLQQTLESDQQSTGSPNP